MALNDLQHVEAVAIIRRLVEGVEGGAGPGSEAHLAGQIWLRENHPAPEVYVNGIEIGMCAFGGHELVGSTCRCGENHL